MAEITIGHYLFSRLSELGIKTVWGVPGNYELPLLDLIGEAGIQFSGNANELIAGYAADGQESLFSTLHLNILIIAGELSAYCAHAGAFAEFVPICHVVGYPGQSSTMTRSTELTLAGVTAMKNRTLMHHTLGTGDFDMYHEMVKHISVDTAILTDPATAANDIDRCLNAMLYESRPVYIGVPVDMSHRIISAMGLKTPLVPHLPPNDINEEKNVIKETLSRLRVSKYPIIILDGNCVRNGCTRLANELAKCTGYAFFTTCMGKGGADETLPNFAGVYQGGGSLPAVRKAVEERADFVLWLGSFRTDFNTGEFTDNVRESSVIDLQRFHTEVGGKKYNVGIKGVLKALLHELEASNVSRPPTKIDWDAFPVPARTSNELTQDYLWSALTKLFKIGDIVVGETGTSAFGLSATKLPLECCMYNQTVFGSIGYAGPSSAGAFQAAKDAGTFKRGILVTGEGSLQLTAQYFADSLKLDHKPIVFVLNNNGYTVERLIHGKDASYNAVPLWDYKALTSVFGPQYHTKYYGPIRTCEALDDLLADEAFNACERFQLVELILPELDAPVSVRLTTEAVEAFNNKNAAGSKTPEQLDPPIAELAERLHESRLDHQPLHTTLGIELEFVLAHVTTFPQVHQGGLFGQRGVRHMLQQPVTVRCVTCNRKYKTKLTVNLDEDDDENYTGWIVTEDDSIRTKEATTCLEDKQGHVSFYKIEVVSRVLSAEMDRDTTQSRDQLEHTHSMAFSEEISAVLAIINGMSGMAFKGIPGR
ncbi:pyruvate decarboxylase, partial [Hortaea werneckii]